MYTELHSPTHIMHLSQQLITPPPIITSLIPCSLSMFPSLLTSFGYLPPYIISSIPCFHYKLCFQYSLPHASFPTGSPSIYLLTPQPLAVPAPPPQQKYLLYTNYPSLSLYCQLIFFQCFLYTKESSILSSPTSSSSANTLTVSMHCLEQWLPTSCLFKAGLGTHRGPTDDDAHHFWDYPCHCQQGGKKPFTSLSVVSNGENPEGTVLSPMASTVCHPFKAGVFLKHSTW